MSEVSRPLTRTAQRKAISDNNEARRREHQKELIRANIEEMKLRYASKYPTSGQPAGERKEIKSDSYKSESQFPRDMTPKVLLDKRHETLFIPINGIPVPFHISYVKSISRTDEGKASYLRINFNVPSKDDSIDGDDLLFLREITVKSLDSVHSQEIVKSVNELKKEKSEQSALGDESLVKQKDLVLSTHGTIGVYILVPRDMRLDDVYLRPAFPGRKYPGEVQIHKNGIRYVCHVKGEEQRLGTPWCSFLDVTFENIQHIIFQSCDGESAVILHLRLREAILVGKKKTFDIQFYRDVLDNSIEETSGRKKKVNYADEDEMEEEREELRRKEAADDEFESFGKRFVEVAGSNLELDYAERELSFPGVIFRQNVLLRHTNECLVFLTELPFFMITWGDVEIAYLERVLFGLKNFDVVFVLKDHSKEPLHVNSIPMTFIEAVKDILNENEVPYAESTVNFNWTNIMKMIHEDPLAFYESGGWVSLQPDNADDNESDTEEESEFEIDDDISSESEEDDEAYSQDDEEEEESAEEESAPDWDELEEEVAQEGKRSKRGRK